MTKPNLHLVDTEPDADRGMEMLAYAVIYVAIIACLAIVAMLYSGIAELPTPDMRSPDYSQNEGAYRRSRGRGREYRL